MAETSIEWAGYTFNGWIGCQRVSPGCQHCYAEVQDSRGRWDNGRTHWGPTAPRYRTSPSTWANPLAWNRKAEKLGARAQVFCSSLADVFEDRPELAPWRVDLFRLIENTPNLDWLLLTKRPENILRLWPDAVPPPGPYSGTGGWPNVWLGTTVEDQQRANERIPHLRAVPAAVHFLSMEPLLEAVKLPRFCMCGCGLTEDEAVREAMRGPAALNRDQAEANITSTLGVDWVICGGESGPGARSFDVEWARSLRDQCAAGGAAFFMKQLGARTRMSPDGGDPLPMFFKKHQSADVEFMPKDLRVREFPTPRAA